MNITKKLKNLVKGSLSRKIDEGENLSDFLDEDACQDGQLQTELDPIRWLRDHKLQTAPRPGFIESGRKHLVSQITTVSWDQNPIGWWLLSKDYFYSRIRLAAITFMLFFFGGCVLTLAAEDSLPGEVLYSYKIATQNIRLALTLQPSKAAELHMQYAQDQLISCAVVSSEGKYDEAMVALRNYERHIAKTGRLVRTLSRDNSPLTDTLFNDFNRIFLQDIETLRVLLPGAF